MPAAQRYLGDPMASSDDELTRHDGPKHRGPDHTSPYPVSRLAPPVDLVDTAREIQKADDSIRSHVGSKLEVIAVQMRALKEQAERIMEDAQHDAKLHRAVCQFQKRPGHIYHLYRKPCGTFYFSMLSPADWDDKPPHEPQGSYRLEADMSWTPVEKIAEQERAAVDVNRLLKDS